MANDYKDSFAQKNMSFTTQTEIITIPGDNFHNLMIFVGASDLATYFVTPPSVDTVTTITATDYTTLTQGLLLDWLADFYANGTTAICYCVAFTDVAGGVWSPTDLATQYALYRYLAFWKTIISSTYLNSACEALDHLRALDSAHNAKFTQIFFGSHDTNLLTAKASDSTSLWYLLTTQNTKTNAWIVYHYSSTHNAALIQLGMTLSLYNAALTPSSPVGSKLGFITIGTIDGSGTAGANLTSTDTTILEEKNVGYFETVGDGSGNVINAMNVNLQGIPLGAWWIPSYIDAVCEIKAATLLANSNSAYLNSATYQLIIALTGSQVKQFVDTGRFTDYSLTKAAFNADNNVSAGKFIIPYAWQATYVDDAEGVTVTGTLYINI